MTIKLDRVVMLIDDYGDVYVNTNAPAEEIKKAIAYENDIRIKDETNGFSDFELIQEYLEKLGYYFLENDDIEKYIW